MGNLEIQRQTLKQSGYKTENVLIPEELEKIYVALTSICWNLRYDNEDLNKIYKDVANLENKIYEIYATYLNENVEMKKHS